MQTTSSVIQPVKSSSVLEILKTAVLLICMLGCLLGILIVNNPTLNIFLSGLGSFCVGHISGAGLPHFIQNIITKTENDLSTAEQGLAEVEPVAAEPEPAADEVPLTTISLQKNVSMLNALPKTLSGPESVYSSSP